jgi:REP element-mobilizing transposase RayT
MGLRLNHEIPEWVNRDATFFVTICALDRRVNTFCHPELGQIVLDSIRWRNEKKIWYCDIVVLMPDHVHLVLHFADEISMTKAIRDWKSWLAKQQGIRWQENYFDHRLRGTEGYGEKAEYVLLNPVRAGFVKRPQDWPYLWLPPWYKVME